MQSQDNGELHLLTGKWLEVYFADIALTDDIRQMNGKIIQCHYVDGKWVFKRLRNDRAIPNGSTTVQGILGIIL